MAFSLAQASLGGATATVPEILIRLLRRGAGFDPRRSADRRGATLYLRFVKRELVVFAVVVVFATAAAAQALHFELLLSLLVADSWWRTWRRSGPSRWSDALHLMAVPVFVIFFAMAGAELRVQAFVALWPLVLGVALLRMGAVYGGIPNRAAIGGAEPVVVRHAWTGLVRRPAWRSAWRPSWRTGCRGSGWLCRR